MTASYVEKECTEGVAETWICHECVERACRQYEDDYTCTGGVKAYRGENLGRCVGIWKKWWLV